MEETTRELRAEQVLKTMRLFIEEHEQDELKEAILKANGDASKYRIAVAHAATYQLMLNARDWAVGMVTKPGDVVYDPAHEQKYVYASNLPLKHDDPNLYPGAEGADYWVIMPQIKDFVKVFPDATHATVSVKKGEVWWDATGTHKYCWMLDDDPDCSVEPEVNIRQWKLV